DGSTAGRILTGRVVDARQPAISAAEVACVSLLMGEAEAATLARRRSHRAALIDPKVEEHKGRIVTTTGDGILIEFPSVVEAVACAVAMQRGMAGPQCGNARAPEDRFPGRRKSRRHHRRGRRHSWRRRKCRRPD